MKISQAIRWLEDIKSEHGDIELLLPDGTPWKKIDIIAPAPARVLSQSDSRAKIQVGHGDINGLSS